MKITKLQADAIYWALVYTGGKITRLSVRRASHRTKMALADAVLAEWRADKELHVTEAGYNAAISYYGQSMRNAEMTQNWRGQKANETDEEREQRWTDYWDQQSDQYDAENETH